VQFFEQLLIFLLQFLIQLSDSVIFFLAFLKPLRSILRNLANFSFELVDLLSLAFGSCAYHLKILLPLFKRLFLSVYLFELNRLLLFNIFK
jgi:hypothetical protein